MYLTIFLAGIAAASAIGAALCFSAAGAAAERPGAWNIDAFLTEAAGIAALLIALGSALAVGVRL